MLTCACGQPTQVVHEPKTLPVHSLSIQALGDVSIEVNHCKVRVVSLYKHMGNFRGSM